MSDLAVYSTIILISSQGSGADRTLFEFIHITFWTGLNLQNEYIEQNQII